MIDLELAWWAGLYEGRGYLVRRVQPSGTVSWHVQVTGRNEALIWKAHRMLDGAGSVSVESVRPTKDGGDRPPQYRLVVANRADLRDLLESLRPLLTPERRREADVFLTWVSDQPTVPRRQQGVRRRARA